MKTIFLLVAVLLLFKDASGEDPSTHQIHSGLINPSQFDTTENEIVGASDKFETTSKRSKQLPILFQDLTVDCSTDLDEHIPPPLLEKFRPEFVQVEKNCTYERIWTARDVVDADDNKAVFQFLRLKAPIVFQDFEETLTVDCDEKSDQDILDLLSAKTPKVKAACFENHVPIELSIEHDVVNFSCPGTFTRTLRATNLCSDETITRNQTLVLVSSCGELACGRNDEPARGRCFKGRCACSPPWSGPDCQKETGQSSTEDDVIAADGENFTEDTAADGSSLEDVSTEDDWSDDIPGTTSSPAVVRQEVVVAQQSMANWFWSIGAVVIPAAILVVFTAFYRFVNNCMKPERDENQNSDSEKGEAQNPNSLRRDVQYELKPFLQNHSSR